MYRGQEIRRGCPQREWVEESLVPYEMPIRRGWVIPMNTNFWYSDFYNQNTDSINSVNTEMRGIMFQTNKNK